MLSTSISGNKRLALLLLLYVVYYLVSPILINSILLIVSYSSYICNGKLWLLCMEFGHTLSIRYYFFFFFTTITIKSVAPWLVVYNTHDATHALKFIA